MVHHRRPAAKVTEEQSLQHHTDFPGCEVCTLHNKNNHQHNFCISLWKDYGEKKKKETINEMIRLCFTFFFCSIFTIMQNFVSKVGSGRDLDLLTKLKFMIVSSIMSIIITKC